MGVALHVGSRSFAVGAPSFVKSFFSTVCVRLERERWGARFPLVMNALYSGELEASGAKPALAELDAIAAELAAFPPSAVVWDFEDRTARPPWGDRIAPEITTMASYYVTSDGKDFLSVLRAALEASVRSGAPVRIQ